MSQRVRIVRHVVAEVIYALFGETRVGIAGAMLQWLSLVIMLSSPTLNASLPATLHLPLLSAGIIALFAGLGLAFRGKSLGPIITIPAVVGIGLLLIVCALCYPLRFLTKE